MNSPLSWLKQNRSETDKTHQSRYLCIAYSSTARRNFCRTHTVRTLIFCRVFVLSLSKARVPRAIICGIFRTRNPHQRWPREFSLLPRGDKKRMNVNIRCVFELCVPARSRPTDTIGARIKRENGEFENPKEFSKPP